MGRYPAQPLAEKEAWMREEQRKNAEALKSGPVAVAPPARPEPPVQPQFLRIRQVAKILNVSESTVHRWFRRNVLIVQGPRQQTVLIPQRTLDEWIRKHHVTERR